MLEFDLFFGIKHGALSLVAGIPRGEASIDDALIELRRLPTPHQSELSINIAVGILPM